MQPAVNVKPGSRHQSCPEQHQQKQPKEQFAQPTCRFFLAGHSCSPASKSEPCRYSSARAFCRLKVWGPTGYATVFSSTNFTTGQMPLMLLHTNTSSA